MNLCTPSSITRRLPARLILCLLAVVSGAAFVAACGGSGGGSAPAATAATVPVTATPSATPSPAAPAPTTAAATALSLYFLRGEELGVAARRVPPTSAPATAALEALLAGPTAAETAAGLASAVPPETRLLGLSIDGTTARVDLSAQFAEGGGLSLQARVAQVVYTLTRFETVKTVAFMLEGSAVDALGSEGLPLGAGQSRSDWSRFEPAIFVEAPGVGAALSSPFILEGTAGVFEGSFKARLVDAGGGEIANATIQASRGAPDRGSYRQTIAFDAAAAGGVLIVYSQSMEDGSRQNEVRIPVGFSSD